MVFFRTHPPERSWVTSPPICEDRGDADRRPHKDHAHRNRSAAIAQTITLLAEIPPQSMTNDPSFSPLADSFCRAARGRCKCRTSGAGAVPRGKHHFLSNLMGTYHHHPLRSRRAAFGSQKFRQGWLAAAYVSQIVRAGGVWPCLCSRHAGTNGIL